MAQASTLVPVTKMKKAPTMAQASTLVPVTKTKKHKRGRLRYHGGYLGGYREDIKELLFFL